MTRTFIFLGILLFLCFCARAQKEFVISSLSKRDKVEMRNYVNGKLKNSVFNYKKKSIHIQIEKSDSLLIIKRGFTPIALLDVNVLPDTIINVGLPYLPKYTPYDTIYRLSSFYNRKSNQYENQMLMETLNNSNQIDSLPRIIEIRINGSTYKGLLNTRKLEEVVEWDSKDVNGTIFYKGMEAIYIVQLKE